jgi:hypothetical protein
MKVLILSRTKSNALEAHTVKCPFSVFRDWLICLRDESERAKSTLRIESTHCSKTEFASFPFFRSSARSEVSEEKIGQKIYIENPAKREQIASRFGLYVNETE